MKAGPLSIQISVWFESFLNVTVSLHLDTNQLVN